MTSALRARFQVAWPGFALDVDLELPGKGVTALYGHSGAGKTTLLRCIAGLERLPGGLLTFQGETWQDDRTWVPTPRRPIGYVFQDVSLFPHLTVRANLLYGVRRSPGLGTAALDHAIELLGIGHLLDRKPDRLSGGERQRVGIARALALRPRLLLMDEPLSALDHARKQEILPYLEHLRDELEAPMVYVSHSPGEVGRLADHIVAMEGGRVVASGPLADVVTRLDLPHRMGDEAGVVIEGVIGERDGRWNLARIDFPGGALSAMDAGVALGARTRCRVLARDVSLSAERVTSSITNSLQATVVEIRPDLHPANVLVRLRVGETVLLARLTRLSADRLALAEGASVWAQVKAIDLH